jgi:molybdenum cofactor cytidylyltransferase
MAMLSAAVLSAGESKRMGHYLKPLLPMEGKTFLEIIVERLRETSADEVLVVLGASHDEVEERVSLGDARVLINENWREGQLSSLLTALAHVGADAAGLLFTLVDHPLVLPGTYRLLVDTWLTDPSRIVVPSHGGRKGHPAIFPSSLFEELRAGGPPGKSLPGKSLPGRTLRGKPLPGGARDLISRHADLVTYVTVSDPGVVRDIDTPEDYQELIGELP